MFRKQRNTIRFSTIRLKWGIGFKTRKHLKPSIKKRTIYSLRPCDVSGAVAYNTACLKQKQTIIPCVPYPAIISEQFLIASVAVSKCDVRAMITETKMFGWTIEAGMLDLPITIPHLRDCSLL